MNAPAFRDRLAGAEPINVWPAPDMTILTGGRSTPPVMPPSLFGNTWALIEDLADGTAAPVDYVALSCLVTAASLIGGKRRVQAYAGYPWAEPCILWAAVVGDPSSRKSPAIDAATSPLRPMELDHATGHDDLLRVWEAQCQRAKVERKAWEANVETARKEHLATPPLPDDAIAPEEPQRRRLMVQDSTPEALAAILAGNPTGTLHLRDELAGWLEGFDRYNAGGRSFWLEAFGGRPFVTDRKGAKTARITFNGVSVLGGIQPERLAECLLKGADDGLVGRFLWAWPNPVSYHRPKRTADTYRLEAIYRRLDSLEHARDERGERAPINLVLTAEAAEVFEHWVREHEQGLGESASLYKSFCGKLNGMVLRIALTAELMAWADSEAHDEPRTVSKRTIVNAIEFVEDYQKPTALRVFGDAALPPVERNAAALGRYIVRNGPTMVNARDLRRSSGIPALKDAEVLADALAHLVEADWLKPTPSRTGDQAGRQRADYLVNPGVRAAA